MDAMKSHIKNILSTFSVVMLAALLMVVAANAQPAPAPKESPEPKKAADTKSTDAKSGQAKSINTKATASEPTKKPAETVPTSNTVGEDAGSYTVTSTIEVGARGLRVFGDTNKFRSDLNYHAGARLFYSSRLMKTKNGNSGALPKLFGSPARVCAPTNGGMCRLASASSG